MSSGGASRPAVATTFRPLFDPFSAVFAAFSAVSEAFRRRFRGVSGADGAAAGGREVVGEREGRSQIEQRKGELLSNSPYYRLYTYYIILYIIRIYYILP